MLSTREAKGGSVAFVSKMLETWYSSLAVPADSEPRDIWICIVVPSNSSVSTVKVLRLVRHYMFT